MRKMSLILLLGLLVSLSACTGAGMQAPKPISLEEHFSVEVPENFQMRNDLHDFAPLQMADESNGYFLLAIEESKIQLQQRQLYYKLADYAHFMESTIGMGYDTSHVTKRDTFELNGYQYQTSNMYASIRGEEAPLEVYYHLTAIETEERFYQIIGWSRRKNAEKMRVAMRSIAQSFQELLPDSRETQQASSFRPRSK